MHRLKGRQRNWLTPLTTISQQIEQLSNCAVIATHSSEHRLIKKINCQSFYAHMIYVVPLIENCTFTRWFLIISSNQNKCNRSDLCICRSWVCLVEAIHNTHNQKIFKIHLICSAPTLIACNPEILAVTCTHMSKQECWSWKKLVNPCRRSPVLPNLCCFCLCSLVSFLSFF